jgi:hypothetical protein
VLPPINRHLHRKLVQAPVNIATCRDARANTVQCVEVHVRRDMKWNKSDVLALRTHTHVYSNTNYPDAGTSAPFIPTCHVNCQPNRWHQATTRLKKCSQLDASGSAQLAHSITDGQLVKQELDVGDQDCDVFWYATTTPGKQAPPFRRNLPHPSVVYVLYPGDGGSMFPPNTASHESQCPVSYLSLGHQFCQRVVDHLMWRPLNIGEGHVKRCSYPVKNRGLSWWRQIQDHPAQSFG